MIDISETVKKTRQSWIDSGKTLREIEKITGVPFRTVSDFLRDKTSPNIATLQRLIDGLDKLEKESDNGR